MGNLHRGEVSETIGGVEYTLRIATNEWCWLEDEYDKSTDEILRDFEEQLTAGRLRLKFIRKLFYVALTGRHPEISEDQAGALMSDLGMIEASTLLGDVIKRSMPDVEEGASGNGKKDPRKAAKA